MNYDYYLSLAVTYGWCREPNHQSKTYTIHQRPSDKKCVNIPKDIEEYGNRHHQELLHVITGEG